MSDAFRCDVCGDLYAGTPAMRGHFNTPDGTEKHNVDICADCWDRYAPVE